MQKKDNQKKFYFVEKPEINELDLEMISTNISNPKKDYIHVVYKIILYLCSKSKEKKTNKKDIIKKAKEFNIDIMRVEDSVERLKRLKKITLRNEFVFTIND